MPSNQIPSTGPRSLALVVEDDTSTFNAMQVLLTHYGFDVLRAATSAEGVAMLAKQPEYLFLDLMLPDGDGTRVLELVRRQRLPIKVAVITGTNDPDRLARVEQLKPEIILTKPLDFLALLDRIKPAA